MYYLPNAALTENSVVKSLCPFEQYGYAVLETLLGVQ